ncbi:MAG: hypothetical protein DMG21_08750, partial [Acidobacteria bacterium]
MSSQEILHTTEAFDITEEAQSPASDPATELAESAEALLSADLAALPAGSHHEGEIVQGTIVKVTDTDVLVDVGLKSEGVVPLGEFKSQDGTLTVAPGDVVALWVERFDEQEGAIRLSRQKAAE